MTCDQLERDLDAYLDRELGPEAERAARAHLNGCAGCRGRLDERLTLSRALWSLPYYETPPRLRARVSAAARRSRAIRGVLAIAAAAVLCITAGREIARRAPAFRDGSAIDAVVDGHARSLMGDHLLDVRSGDQHTVKPWFTGKLDFSPPVVDLATIGYPLAGGRVDFVNGRAAAALVYLRHQHVINVFIASAPEAATRQPAAQSTRGFHIRRWTSAGLSFWVVSDLNDADLDAFVAAFRSP
jgi:anti-sigma factor RsiW